MAAVVKLGTIWKDKNTCLKSKIKAVAWIGLLGFSICMRIVDIDKITVKNPRIKKWQRTILGGFYVDHITNDADHISIARKRKLRWYRHVIIRASNLSTINLQGKIFLGKRKSRQRGEWVDNVNEYTRRSLTDLIRQPKYMKGIEQVFSCTATLLPQSAMELIRDS